MLFASDVDLLVGMKKRQQPVDDMLDTGDMDDDFDQVLPSLAMLSHADSTKQRASAIISKLD